MAHAPGAAGDRQHIRLPWLAASLAAAALAWWAAPADAPVRAGLAIFTLAAALWLTQALPLAATALLVPLLAVLTGIQAPAPALAPFASPILFLFLGGFALAAALQQHGLAQALASRVLQMAGGRRARAVVLLAGFTALASLWMSNTAAAALMLPLALALLDGQDEAPGPGEQAFTLLALTYSCALGGMASLVSTPPNAMASAHAGLSFGAWFARAAPVALLLWTGMLLVLYLSLRPRLAGRIAVAPAPWRWDRARIATALIFAATVTGWAGGATLGRRLGIASDTSALVGIAAVVALLATGALDWRALERQVQWGVLVLFGGGLALSSVMDASGASAFLVQRVLALLAGAPPTLLLLGVVAFIVLLSELMSNTASAALALPLFMPMAPALGLAPEAMAMAIALAASCGFMLPVATPPNAMVFGTGRVPQRMMMRAGWKLDLLCIAGITAAARWAWA